MSIAFFYAILSIYILHSLIDALCTIVTLLDPILYSYYNTNEAFIYSDSEEKQSDSKMKPSEESQIFLAPSSDSWLLRAKSKLIQVRLFWESLLKLYPSLFKEEANSGPMQMRFFIYWIAAMGIVRTICVFYTNITSLLCVSFMYFLEFLVFEYEGFTSMTIVAQKARVMSIFALVMCIMSIVLCLWL